MGDPTVRERTSPETETTDFCCEPDCGPDTCGPAEAAVKFLEMPGMVAEQCCEPDCGPETCDC